MAKLTKKQKINAERVNREVAYSAVEGFDLVKELATAKFNESVDVAISLGIDPKKSDQVVRGAVVLPNGTGKMFVLPFLRVKRIRRRQKSGC